VLVGGGEVLPLAGPRAGAGEADLTKRRHRQLLVAGNTAAFNSFGPTRYRRPGEVRNASAKTVFEENPRQRRGVPAVLLRGGRRARHAGLAWPQPLAG